MAVLLHKRPIVKSLARWSSRAVGRFYSRQFISYIHRRDFRTQKPDIPHGEGPMGVSEPASEERYLELFNFSPAMCSDRLNVYEVAVLGKPRGQGVGVVAVEVADKTGDDLLDSR